MATKHDRVVGSNAGLLCIKSHNLLITWSHKFTWQIKYVLNSLSRELSLSKLIEGWLMIRSHISNHKATYSFNHVVTWAHLTNKLPYIFTSTSPITTKRNRVVACDEEPPLTKQYGSLIINGSCINEKNIANHGAYKALFYKLPELLTLKTNYNKLKKIKNFIITLLKFVFSDIINGYWM